MTIENAVYWDSCVFLSLLLKTAGRYESCLHVHDEAKADKIRIVTSTATLSEVARIHDVGVIDADQSKKILDFFENDFIVVRQLDRDTGNESHKLARDHNIMPLDAIHLATALQLKVPVVHTFDSKKSRRKGLLRFNGKFGTPLMKVIVPPEPPKSLLSFVKPENIMPQKSSNETSEKKKTDSA